MFILTTPEKVGIESESVIRFIEKLEKRGARTHGILMMRHGEIFAEGYWKPFHKDFCHRMYSQTKSIVGIAIGLLEEEGKLSLDDKIVDHFPEKLDGKPQPYLEKQTIRDMLTMTTVGGTSWWFVSDDPDRTHMYLNEKRAMHPSGSLWSYDSPGSQVLSSLVEKLAGKPLLSYMKEKLFDEMGVFQTATVLKTPNGDSWGDSAMVCTLRDMAALGCFVMQKGVWNGKRLMNTEYLEAASSKLVDNNETSHYSAYHQGYGYQIWRVCGNGFAFVGMGDQLTVCFPEQDFVFACVSDNQGTNLIREMIFAELEDSFVTKFSDRALPPNPAAQQRLQSLLSSLQLYTAKGLTDSPLRARLNGKKYVCENNPMGITEFSFVFTNEKEGEFRYTNAQGKKTIAFGVNENRFGKFPQFGYANDYGRQVTTDGFLYDDAVSLAWLEENKLMLLVQVIDRYFGNMSATFYFKGDEAYASFAKTAEYFLMEYEGTLLARLED